MRMDESTFVRLRAAILSVPDAARMREDYRARGLSDERFRWDLLFRTAFPVRQLYTEGLNDAHIDTALRRIVAELPEGQVRS